MTIILLVMITVVLILFGYIIVSCNANSDGISTALFICIVLSILSGMLINIKNNSSKPTAMDVYKGKTTLEITYKDSIPVDSIVVFK